MRRLIQYSAIGTGWLGLSASVGFGLSLLMNEIMKRAEKVPVRVDAVSTIEIKARS